MLCVMHHSFIHFASLVILKVGSSQLTWALVVSLVLASFVMPGILQGARFLDNRDVYGSGREPEVPNVSDQAGGEPDRLRKKHSHFTSCRFADWQGWKLPLEPGSTPGHAVKRQEDWQASELCGHQQGWLAFTVCVYADEMWTGASAASYLQVVIHSRLSPEQYSPLHPHS